MTAITNFKSIYVNSSPAYRDLGGTNENFTITENGNHFSRLPRRVKLMKANIPYTWNNITVANNSFILKEFPGPTTFNVTIPDGHYNGTELATAIQTALNTSGAAYTYTVSFSTTTLHFTISATGNFSLDFTGSNSIATQMGFPVGYISPVGATTDSTIVAQLVPDYEIFICSDLVEGCDNGIVRFTPDPPATSAALGGILAVIPLSACFGAVIGFQDCCDGPFFPISQSYYGKVRSIDDNALKSMNFFLQFPSGIPVNLNGAHWSAQLLFEF